MSGAARNIATAALALAAAAPLGGCGFTPLYAEGGVSAFELAGAYAAIGDGGEALSLLRASVDRREPENVSLDVDPAFAGLRGEDEFRRLRQRVNTPRPAETTPDAPASVR